MKNNKYSSFKTLVTSLVLFIIGAILFTNPEDIVILVSQIFGGILAVIGLFNFVFYYRKKSKGVITNNQEFVSSVVLMVIGLLFIFLAGAFETALRFIMGIWILLSGINKLIAAITLGPKTKNYTSMLIVSVILLLGGMYIILWSNLVLSVLGIVIMIYSGIEIYGYIIYKIMENSKESANETDVIIPEKEVREKEFVKDAKEVEVKEVKDKGKGQKKK